MNKFDKRNKLNSISALQFSTLKSKLLHNIFLILRTNFADLGFFDEKIIYFIAVSCYSARWVKDIKRCSCFFPF